MGIAVAGTDVYWTSSGGHCGNAGSIQKTVPPGRKLAPMASSSASRVRPAGGRHRRYV